MSRLFNVEVFNQTIGEGGPYFSGQEFYGVLGSADAMSVQIIVDAVVLANTIVVVEYQVNNTSQEQMWDDTPATKTITVAALVDVPMQATITAPMPGFPNGAYGRFKVTSDKAAASVRIVVCGRSS